jgi:hypothetical protein
MYFSKLTLETPIDDDDDFEDAPPMYEGDSTPIEN